MASRSRTLAVLLLGIVCWGVAAAGVAQASVVAVGSWHAATLVVALAVMSAVFAILVIPISGMAISVGSLVSYLSIVLLGPWAAVGIKVVGFLAAFSWGVRPRGAPPWRFVLTNVGVLAATILLAGAAYRLVGGVPGMHVALTARLLLPYVVMSVTYTFVNLALLMVLRALLGGQALWASMVDKVRQFWINGLLWAIIGLITQAIYTSFGLLGLFMVFATLLAARFTFQQYATNQKTRSEMAGVLSRALSFKDPYTGEHSLRVAAQSVGIGRHLGLTESQLEKLRDAALLHDIGKVAVPDAVLIKPGPLDVAEKVSMERHVGAGGDLLEQSPHLRELAGYVRAHHAQLGEEADPPLLARIIAVADAFDAMTSDRPYRRALPMKEALSRLVDGRGTQFDAVVVDALFHTLRAQGHDIGPPLVAHPRESSALPRRGGAPLL